jgi:hypothetical protein
MEPKGFLIYSKRGITHASINSKQYPSNSLDQNNLAMVFMEYPHEGIAFYISCGMAMKYPSRF